MKTAYSYLAKGVCLFLITYMSAAMIASPLSCINSAKEAIFICGNIVIPTLFPFIFCGNMLVALGAARIASRYMSRLMQPFFGVSGSGALAFVLGIVSGYPVGAICSALLYSAGECSKNEAEKLLAFCNNSGPMFIIGAVGVGMLGNYKLGVLLYITHIFSALLCGMIFKGFGKEEKTKALPPSTEQSDIKTAAVDIGAAVVKSVNSTFTICGFVIIFAVFVNTISNIKGINYIYPLLEITGGLKNFIGEENILNKLPFIAFFIAFSGISVFLQVYAIAKPAGLSVTRYIAGKALQGLIAFFMVYISIKLFPCTCETFSAAEAEMQTALSPIYRLYWSTIIMAYAALGFSVALAIAKIYINKKNKVLRRR